MPSLGTAFFKIVCKGIAFADKMFNPNRICASAGGRAMLVPCNMQSSPSRFSAKGSLYLFSSNYFAAFAFSHRAVKAAGSWIAVSDSILRFMSIPASFRPCMKVE